MPQYLLKLYISSRSPRSKRAIIAVRQMCEEEIAGEYELVIIDVLEHPELAEREKILVTPALIKTSPPPPQRVIGDLTDTEKIMQILDPGK